MLTPQARGYGLAMLAAVVMFIGAVRASDTKATRDVVLFAVGAVVGIFTLPVFAIAAVAQAGVLLWNTELRKRDADRVRRDRGRCRSPGTRRCSAAS